MMEKLRENQKGLHVAFIDLQKSYDRVSRQDVWKSMRERSARKLREDGPKCV